MAPHAVHASVMHQGNAGIRFPSKAMPPIHTKLEMEISAAAFLRLLRPDGPDESRCPGFASCRDSAVSLLELVSAPVEVSNWLPTLIRQNGNIVKGCAKSRQPVDYRLVAIRTCRSPVAGVDQDFPGWASV